MRGAWQSVVESVLRPARPGLERCLAARELHLASRKPAATASALAKKDCERRIERARAAAFAADDGVVSGEMTRLEREWRRLARIDADAGWMDLWAKIAPAAWIDDKRWRDADPALRLEVAVALAADVDGIEAAEVAIDSLRGALAAWATPIGARVRWNVARDVGPLAALLSEPRRRATEAIASSDLHARLLERARTVEADVRREANERLPQWPLLADDLAHAAFVECLVHDAELGLPNPVAPLRALLSTGYVVTSIGASGLTLGLPRL